MELQQGKKPYSVVDADGTVVVTSDDEAEIVATWQEDQTRKIVDADGHELGIISAASRRRR